MAAEEPLYEEGSVSQSVTNEDGTPYIPEIYQNEEDVETTENPVTTDSEETGDEVTSDQLRGFLAQDIQVSFDRGEINMIQFERLKAEIVNPNFSEEDFSRINRMLEGFEEENWRLKQGDDFNG